MSVLVIILAVLAGVVGIIGSVVPALPGPPVSWVGLMILYFWGKGTNGAISARLAGNHCGRDDHRLHCAVLVHQGHGRN